MMITEIDDYFTKGCGRCDKFDTPECSTRHWAQALADLRRICLDMGLDETVKWGHPCYMHAGRNIVILGAFRDNLRMTFFKAALMKDPEAILQRQGPNTQTPDMIRFADNAAPGRLEPTIRAYLAEAMGYAAAGIKPPKRESPIDLPDEMIAAMDADPTLAEAFHNLTPGRQRGYALHFSGAKQAQTRINRIAKYRDKILAGRGFHD